MSEQYGHEKYYWEYNKMYLKYKIKIYVDLLIVEKKKWTWFEWYWLFDKETKKQY